MKIFLYILLSVALLSCGRTDKENAYLEELARDQPLQEAYNVVFIMSETATMKAKLEAPHVIEKLVNEERVSYFDRGLHLTFYTPEGLKESDLTANAGEFQNKFSSGLVYGNVVVVTSSGKRLETEKLYWDRDRDRIYTNEMVKIRTDDQIIYGDSMESDMKFTNHKIFKIRSTTNLTD